MQLKLNLTLETVQDGQYYLKGTRLDFNLPYQIFIVKGDSHFKPYFRVHINYELAAIYYTEKQCENFLLKLTKEQAHTYDIKDNKSTLYKSYAIVFQYTDSGRVAVDTFMGKTEAEAKGAFKECYRHAPNFKILAAVEVPEKEGEKEDAV